MLSIIGCGNLNRQDDAVGICVVQKLMKDAGHYSENDLKIFDSGTSGMDVMFQARGSDALIIIDANQSGSEPGSIFEVPGEELANLPEPSYNLHDFRWDHALYAGKKIYKDEFPNDVTVFLIEAEKLGLGIGLSERVEKAAERVAEKVLQRVEKILG